MRNPLGRDMVAWYCMQLLCSPIGNRNFITKTKHNFMTEWMTHSVFPFESEAITIPFPRPQRSLCSSQTSSRGIVWEEARGCLCCSIVNPVGCHRSTSQQLPLRMAPCGIVDFETWIKIRSEAWAYSLKVKIVLNVDKLILQHRTRNAVIPETVHQSTSSRWKRRIRQRGLLRRRCDGPWQLYPSFVEMSVNMGFSNEPHLHHLVIFRP